jgi:hypothetical protein
MLIVPSRGPPPPGDRQDRATLPPYHVDEAVHKPLEARTCPSPSRQGPRQAHRGSHGRRRQRGNTPLPSARGPMGFDSPGQLLQSPLHSCRDHRSASLSGGMPHGRQLQTYRQTHTVSQHPETEKWQVTAGSQIRLGVNAETQVQI